MVNMTSQVLRMKTSKLVALLKAMKRECVISGKKVSQVHSGLLEFSAGIQQVTSLSLVKDGITGWSRLHAETLNVAEQSMEYPIADIDLLLGALKAHGSEVSITSETMGTHKLRIKSTGKSTTLTSSALALAFPNGQETIASWWAKSIKIDDKFDASADCYITGSGEELPTTINYDSVCAETFATGIEAAYLNGQTVESVVFEAGPHGFRIHAGKHQRGKTVTTIHEWTDQIIGTYVLGGGLENVVRYLGPNGNIHIGFIPWPGKDEALMWLRGDNGYVIRRVKNA